MQVKITQFIAPHGEHGQNQQNRSVRRDNASGYKGVKQIGNRWQAQIRRDGRLAYLGLFRTPKEAHAAYCAAANEQHKDFARVS